MAFQNILDTLSSTIHRDTFSNPLLESNIEPFRKSISQFPYKIPTSAHQFFLLNGIQISGFGSKPHPHPIHKTLELNLLKNVWTSFCSQPSTVLFMKESKFKKLQQQQPRFQKLINYHLTARDSSRYSTSSDNLPSTSQCFMHDSLMYFEPAQILDLFLKAPQLEKLYASAIIPPESHFSTNFSFHPSIYRYQIKQDQLHYYLESNQAHSYTQPAAAIQWLRATKIIHPSLTLTITVLDSYGPLHNILIQRGSPPISPDQDEISFQTPDCILLPAPNDIQQNFAHRLIPTPVYNALFTYVRAVRTLRITDPAGFVRTQSNKPEYSWVHSAAWDNLQQFAVLTAPYRPISHYFLFRSPLARFLHYMKTNQFRFLQISTVVSTLFSTGFSLTMSKLFTHSISQLKIFSCDIISPPATIQSFFLKPLIKVGLLQRANRRFCLHLLSKPIRIRNHPVPAFLVPYIPDRFLSRPKVPAFYIYASFAVCAMPFFFLLRRWACGPDTPQQIHDQYVRYFHPTSFQLTIPREPIFLSSTKPFLPFETQLPGKPTEPEPLEFQSFPSQPPSPPPSQPEPLEETVNTTIPTFQEFRLKEPTFPTAEPVFYPLPPPANPISSLRFPSSIPPSIPAISSNPFMDIEEKPLIPDFLGTFTGDMPTPATETTSSNPLDNDPTAAGPILNFSETVQTPFLNDSGSFPVRRRCNWDGPFPDFPTTTCCLLTAVSSAIGVPSQTLWNDLCHILPDSLLNEPLIYTCGLTTDHLAVLSSIYKFSVTIHSPSGQAQIGVANAPNHFHIQFSENPNHFSHIPHAPSETQTTPIRAASSVLQKSLLTFRFNDHPLPFSQIHSHQANVHRAKNLISNMKNGYDGVLASIDPIHPSKGRETILALDLTCDVAPKDRSCSLIHLSGFAGCGKTRPIVQLLKRRDFSQFRVVTPTTELRAEWKDLLKLEPSHNWRVSTWESALLKNAPILVIDEVYKMPRGYLDLALIADPTIELVILLGDPLQGEYHSTSSSSSNSRLTSEIDYLLQYIDYYCLWSYRIPQSVAKFFQIQSFNPRPGFVQETRQINPSAPVLTSAANTAKTLHQCGYHALTIASSQGSTYPTPVTIHLDRNINLLSPSHTLVALTRSKLGIFFSGDLSVLHASNQNPMLSKFAKGTPIDLQHAFPSIFKKLPILLTPLTNRRLVARGATNNPSPTHVLIPSNIKPTSPPPDFSPQELCASTNTPSPAHTLQIQHHFPKPQPTTTAICDPNFKGDVLLTSSVLLGDGELNQPQVSTHFLPTSRRPLHTDIPSDNNSPTPLSVTTPTPCPHEPVYPGIDFRSLASNFLPACDPTAKEILFKDSFSNQFPFLDHPNLLAPQSLRVIAPDHNSKRDETLLVASISKRLRFRPSPHPYSITPRDTLLGTLLFSALCSAYRRSPNLSIPFNPALYVRCIALNEFAQLTSKTQKVIMSNAFRSDPDWRWTAVRIFSKTQHKVNEGSIFGPWKACQTLALMHDALILLLGPVKKYQRLIDESDRPDHIYIHAGHTPYELSTWCQTHLSTAEHVANDYTAFDQSQHGEAVVLEILKMKRVGIPENLIELHRTIKTSISTQFGPLTCMRLTGEPGTYDDNTDYNLAVIHLQYSISNQPILVSGDDSLIDSQPPIHSFWPTIEPLLNLKFKTETSLYGLFCGYYVGPAGACRSPLALFAKLSVAFDDGSHLEKLPSYLTEFSIGHSLGDAMWNLFPVEHVLYQSACFDYFCQFASRSQKVLLRLGEPDPSALEAISEHLKHASYTVFCLLSSTARTAYLKIKSKIHFPSNPEVDSIQAELLSSSNPSQCLIDFPTSQIQHPSFQKHPIQLPPPTKSHFPLRGGHNHTFQSQPHPFHQSAFHPLPHLHLPATTFSPNTVTIPSNPSQPSQLQSPGLPSTFSIPPMESALSNLLASAIPTLLSKSFSSTSNDPLAAADQLHQDPVSLSGTHGSVVATPAPAAPIPFPSQLQSTPHSRPSRSDLIRTFQWNAYDLTGTESKTTSIDIATNEIILNLARPYQFAKLVSLEVVLMPTHNAIKYPVTCEVLWAPENASIGPTHIMDTYSSTRLVAGSLTNPSEHMNLPCDLALNNPVMKDRLSYNDRPRLYIKFWQNSDSVALGINALISASLFIRGRLEISSPAICATYK